MTEILICPNCRTETYGVFCGNCGTKIKNNSFDFLAFESQQNKTSALKRTFSICFLQRHRAHITHEVIPCAGEELKYNHCRNDDVEYNSEQQIALYHSFKTYD